jgi:hypothetical protein
MTAFHHLVKRRRKAEQELEKQAEVVGQGAPRDLSCSEAALGEAEGRGLTLSLPRVRSLGCGPTARTGNHRDVFVESLDVELGHDRP